MLNIFLAIFGFLQSIFALTQGLFFTFFGIVLRFLPFLGTVFRFFQGGLWMIVERIFSVSSVFFSMFKFVKFFRRKK